MIVVASFSHQQHGDYRIGLPRGGQWLVRFSADWQGYSPDFSGVGELRDEITAEKRSPMMASATAARSRSRPTGFLVLGQEVTLEEPHPDETAEKAEDPQPHLNTHANSDH